MAIVFNCPHCATNYRLKDEFGGKTATCKNPNCRKVIPIPKANGAIPAAPPADLDAIAAAAFLDEPAKADQPAEQMIPVTCTGCDHTWSVEASKEGKNVRCPECGKVVRVPMRKKEEKADWRSGGGGPSLARKETGLDREGAFGTVNAGGISEGTAREIVKGREAEEEPEERRKRRIKWAVRLLILGSVVGVGVYFYLQHRRVDRAETRMEDAVAELTGKNGTQDGRYVGLIHRASAESRIRLAGSAEDAAAALKDLQLARNKAKGSPGGKSADNAAVLADVAVTAPLLLGNKEQTEKGERLKEGDVLKEIRQALAEVPDAELMAEVIRGVTREAAKIGYPTLADGVAHQLKDGPELIAQIGLELLRIDRTGYRREAEELLPKIGNADTNGVQALRAALGKPALAKKEGKKAAEPSPAAEAEAAAINGDAAKAVDIARKVLRKEDRAKALAAVGQTLVASHPNEATKVLVEAATALREAPPGAVSPWVSVRVCRLLGRVGQFDEAEKLANSLPDEQTKAWGRLEALRGRLEAMKDKKGDDAWLGPIGDPTKFAAAAKAHEVMARHNAAAGFGGDYHDAVKKWPPGTVRPFGLAGLVLGQLDRDGK